MFSRLILCDRPTRDRVKLHFFPPRTHLNDWKLLNYALYNQHHTSETVSNGNFFQSPAATYNAEMEVICFIHFGDPQWLLLTFAAVMSDASRACLISTPLCLLNNYSLMWFSCTRKIPLYGSLLCFGSHKVLGCVLESIDHYKNGRHKYAGLCSIFIC